MHSEFNNKVCNEDIDVTRKTLHGDYIRLLLWHDIKELRKCFEYTIIHHADFGKTNLSLLFPMVSSRNFTAKNLEE